MANNQNQTNEKNYVGSSFPSDYQGQFNGFTVYLNKADLAELEKFMNEEGRVGVSTRFAKDPTKAYSVMFTPKVRDAQQQPAASTSQGAGDDLPF